MILALLVITVVSVIILKVTHRKTEQTATVDATVSSAPKAEQTVLNEIDQEEPADEDPIETEEVPEYSEGTVLLAPETIPEYRGEISTVLGNDSPNFTEYEVRNTTGEHYSDLDRLGRCGSAYAMIDESLMPTEERGSIGQVKPSGWNQEKYPGYVNSDPPYLYNRCHLIAYSLTGENANERNLITGTRYFNTEGMLPYEMQVLDYLNDTGNRVLYRVTPYFKDKELVARGVELEAYSVEDRGRGISFHVFIYNVQPGIDINYADGSSKVRTEN